MIQLRQAGPHARFASARWQSTSSVSSTSEAGPSKSSTSSIPILPRPLGITKPPVSSPKTYVKGSDKFYDGERSRQERKVL